MTGKLMPTEEPRNAPLLTQTATADGSVSDRQFWMLGTAIVAIAFLILYITGKKEHREFVRSMAKFDAERSGAEDPSIRVGEKWDPRKAKLLFDLAGYFTPSFHQVKFPDGDGPPSFDRLVATYR